MRKGSSVLVFIALAATLGSLAPVRSWPVELLASFRVQLMLFSLGAAAIALAARARLLASLVVVPVLVQAALSIPLFVSAAADDAALSGGRSLRVLTLNLEWSNREGEAVCAMILRQDPDIVALQEVDGWWKRRLAALGDAYPYRFFDEVSTRPGVAVLAKIEPVADAWHPLLGRAFLSIVFADDEGRFRFVNVHAYPPKSPALFGLRNDQIDRVARWLPRDGLPTILAGDMNITPWSPVLRDFERTTGLESVRAGRGTLPTWPSQSGFFRVPIDHLYHDAGFATAGVSRVPILGSDHIGLAARFVHVPLTHPRRGDTIVAS